MVLGYAYTPAIWPLLLASLLILLLAAYSWRQRRVPGALPFMAACVLATPWIVGAATELAAADPTARIFWYRFQGLWQLPTSVAITCFALEYVWPGRLLTPRNLAMLAAIPVLSVLAVLTNDLHHLMWRGFVYDQAVTAVRGPMYWVSTGYMLVQGLVNMAAFSWLFYRSPEHRPPAAIVLTAILAARVLLVLQVGDASHLPLRGEVIAVLVACPAYAVALFGFRILDPTPLARRTVLAQMLDGMLVLGLDDRVLSLNPAALGILGVPVGSARGRPIRALLPGCPDVLGEAAQAEIRLAKPPGTRHYALACSALRDWRGQTAGRLVLLQDVTEQRQAQAQILEQQRALAMLQEREQLARDLHDSLSQSLAFVNVQAQAVQIFLQRGQHEDADGSLQRLAEVTRTLQDDMRVLIGHLLGISEPDRGLGQALRQVMARFQQQTGLQARLDLDGGVEALCEAALLPPATALQLTRVAQEALANVGKHAGRPSEVGVYLSAEMGLLRMVIADNGAGFDSAQAGRVDGHYGLQVMEDRATSIGGRVTVESSPGEGTRVEVSVPLGQIPGTDGAESEAT